jgi:hypothetical protein
MEDMYERAEFAKELGSVIVMVDLVDRLDRDPEHGQLVPQATT